LGRNQYSPCRYDTLTPGVRISSGSDDVFIGGWTVQYLDIDDQIPGWLLVVVDALMIFASMGKAVVSVAKLGLTQGLKAARPCALSFGATDAASYIMGTYVIGPLVGSVGRYHRQSRRPHDRPQTVAGFRRNRFYVTGPDPSEWSRFYASDLTVDSLGRGWGLSWEQSLRRSGSFSYPEEF